MSMTQEKMYMNVDDVCAVLGVSKAFAYKIMKGYNEELKERGFLVIPGKISTKFLAEKIYGMKVHTATFRGQQGRISRTVWAILNGQPSRSAERTFVHSANQYSL